MSVKSATAPAKHNNAERSQVLYEELLNKLHTSGLSYIEMLGLLRLIDSTIIRQVEALTIQQMNTTNEEDGGFRPSYIG